MNIWCLKSLRRLAVVVLILNACMNSLLAEQADLPTEIDKVLQQSGQAGDSLDASSVLRMRAIVCPSASPEQLRACEQRLVASLESQTSLTVKMDVCRILWIIGTAQSTQAFKKMLGQPETVDMACYAIAGSQVPELGLAVREALPASKGQVTVSLLNLLGQRRDSEAVGLIVPFLKNGATNISASAVAALGKIGGIQAVAELDAVRKTDDKNQRFLADDAYLRAIDTLDKDKAVLLCRKVINDKGETHLARRGALLRLSKHDPCTAQAWLLATLREEEPTLKPIVGQALRNLKDKKVINKVTACLSELSPSSQTIVIETFGPALSTKSLIALMKQPAVRSSALQILATRGDAQVATALLHETFSQVTTEDRRELFRLLRNLPGKAATDVLVRTLPTAPAPVLSDMVKCLAARGVCVPAAPLLERARQGDSDARIQVIHALRGAATASDCAALYALLTASSEPEVHAALEDTIGAVIKRSENIQHQSDWLLKKFDATQRLSDRQALLRLLSRTGTTNALNCVLKQVRTSNNAEERDVAFRALTDWPNGSALDVLVELVVTPLNEKQVGLALRAVVRLLADPAFDGSKKTDIYHRLMPLTVDPATRKLLPEELAKSIDESVFTSLFDGRSLAGWEGDLQVFRLEDGAIVGGSLTNPVAHNTFLCTTNEYVNFDLRLKFKLIGANVNAGVQIRSRRIPGNHEVSGYQADLGQVFWGNIYDESRRNRILVRADQEKLAMVLNKKDWNDYRILCQNKRIQLWINGHQTADYTETEENIKQTGIIGLQIHGGPPGEAWYKDIKIKEIK